MDDGTEEPTDSKPTSNSFNNSSRRRRVLRKGFMGLLAALSVIGLLTLYSSPLSRLFSMSENPTFEFAGDAIEWTYDSDMTVLPPRTYGHDEKYFIPEYSPWLGFNNMSNLRIRHCAYTATYLNPRTMSRNDQNSTFALDLGYFFDLPHLAEKAQGRVIDFRTFMYEIVGAKPETQLWDVDVEYGIQVFRTLRSKTRPDYFGPRVIRRNNRVVAGESSDDRKDGGREIVLKTVQRKPWDRPRDLSRTFITNLIKNGLVDTLEDYGPSEHDHVQEDGSVNVNRIFYAFGDVQGGGVGWIVNWSVQFQYKQVGGDDKKTASDTAGAGVPSSDSKGRPLLDICRPPVEDPSADQIPWESRFLGFATCHIDNYVGLAQELGSVDADILSVEGQLHTTG
ncbi:hypothetical protein BGX23_001767 [Mortierella sp. AD031]|nr:hypothetical protein BGX23_001767 [Mortierella sp. AD031]